MNEITFPIPPTGTLIKASIIALVTASLIFIMVILPAEYQIDPTGSGKLLGLTDLARPNAAQPAQVEIPEATILPVLDQTEQLSRWGKSPLLKGTFISQGGRFQFDSREIELQPKTGMEIKYNMKKGAGLVYSWEADDSVLFDFHGQPDVKPAGNDDNEDYFESYQLNDRLGLSRASATFVAPSDGIHGWFWENRGSKAVKIRLTTAGFYDWIYRNARGKHDSLKPMDAYSLPSHPTIPDEAIE
jgi:hypothetical protein